MNYSRIIRKIKPNGLVRVHENKQYIYLAVIGIFDTNKVHWDYYYASMIDVGGSNFITNDCTKYPASALHLTVQSLISYCTKVQTEEEATKWCEDFKMKWETGSNDLLTESRDKKINEILK